MSVPERFPGIKTAPPDQRGILLYDGDCGFCQKAARWLQSHSRTRLAVEPVQLHLAALAPEAAATAASQVLWITPQGEILGGSLAITQALRSAGHPWQAAFLQAAQPFTRLVYQQIARHRQSARICPLTPEP